MEIKDALRHPLVTHTKANLWGSGVITTPEDYEQYLIDLDDEGRRLVRAFFLAATTGCPVPITLAKDPKYGPQYQEERYLQVNFWYRFLAEGPLKDTAFGHPVDLTFLGGGHDRQDVGWIPEGQQRWVKGPSTYEGFTIPRMLIDIIRFSVKYNDPPKRPLDASASLVFALNLIESAPKNSLRVIASLANYMSQLGFGAQYISDRIFDPDYRQELPEAYWGPLFDQVLQMIDPAISKHVEPY